MGLSFSFKGQLYQVIFFPMHVLQSMNLIIRNTSSSSANTAAFGSDGFLTNTALSVTNPNNKQIVIFIKFNIDKNGSINLNKKSKLFIQITFL